MTNTIRNTSAEKGRVVYFDKLRCLACLAVVMIHSSASFAEATVGSVAFWVGNFFDSLSRIAVPLFVMLSGALLLEECRPFSKAKWGRRMGKLVLFWLFWSAAYALAYEVATPVAKGEVPHFGSFLLALLQGPYHLWFIPMILGLYLLVPLLRLWVKRANSRYVFYFLALAFVFSFAIPQDVQLLTLLFPKAEVLSKLTENLAIPHAAGYCVYFVLGWYLHNVSLRREKLLLALGVAGAAITVLGTWALSLYTGTPCFLFNGNFTVNVLAYASGVFLFAKKFLGRTEPCRAAALVSRYSLGIYGVHVILTDVMLRVFPAVHPLAAVPAIFFLVSIFSLLIAVFLGKLPSIPKFSP